MKIHIPGGRLAQLALLGVLALGASCPVLADASHGGGHGQVRHGGFAGARLSRSGFGGYHGGGGAYGYRGGYPGGYRGGWGYRGGYGYGWGALGLGLGLYFATLPPYYSTYWWGGVPYYYADETYYRWDGSVGQYETVAPPPEAQNPAAGGSAPSEWIAYPKNGQSAEQQAKDKYECHSWAVNQTGFDPTAGSSAKAGPNGRAEYLRAQAACLDGRGYSVR